MAKNTYSQKTCVLVTSEWSVRVYTTVEALAHEDEINCRCASNTKSTNAAWRYDVFEVLVKQIHRVRPKWTYSLHYRVFSVNFLFHGCFSSWSTMFIREYSIDYFAHGLVTNINVKEFTFLENADSRSNILTKILFYPMKSYRKVIKAAHLMKSYKNLTTSDKILLKDLTLKINIHVSYRILQILTRILLKSD